MLTEDDTGLLQPVGQWKDGGREGRKEGGREEWKNQRLIKGQRDRWMYYEKEEVKDE